MKFKFYLLSIFLTSSIIDFSCTKSFKTREIEDCTQNQSFYLDKDIVHPNMAIVIIKGQIDNQAMVNDILIGPGKVDTLIHRGDWYDDPFKIEYKPLNIKKGELVVMYKFY